MPTVSPLARSTFVAGLVVVSVRWHAAHAPEPTKRVEVTVARPAGAAGAGTAAAAGESEIAAVQADGVAGVAGAVGVVGVVGRFGAGGEGGGLGSDEAEGGGSGGADVDAPLPPPHPLPANASTNARPRMHENFTAHLTLPDWYLFTQNGTVPGVCLDQYQHAVTGRRYRRSRPEGLKSLRSTRGAHGRTDGRLAMRASAGVPMLPTRSLCERWAIREFHRGRVEEPIRNSSTARAHCLPSRIAHTTRLCPRRMSPAANTLGTLVT